MEIGDPLAKSRGGPKGWGGSQAWGGFPKYWGGPKDGGGSQYLDPPPPEIGDPPQMLGISPKNGDPPP